MISNEATTYGAIANISCKAEFDPALLAWIRYMHCVYLLQSKKDGYLYVGNTNDVERRLNEHNKGSIYSTKKHVPFKLAYYEAYLDRQDAIERERKLKHHGSVIGHLKKRLKNSLSKRPSQKGGV